MHVYGCMHVSVYVVVRGQLVGVSKGQIQKVFFFSPQLLGNLLCSLLDFPAMLPPSASWMLLFQVGASIPGSVGAVLNDTTYLPISTVTYWKAALGSVEKVLGSELVKLHIIHRAATSHAQLSWCASPSYSLSKQCSHLALVSLASLTTIWHGGAVGHRLSWVLQWRSQPQIQSKL